MFKAIVNGVKKASKKVAAATMTAALTVVALVGSATSALAAPAGNADLTAVTGNLTDGAGDMKTNFITMIGVIIPIIIVVFGIGWLIVLFKKKMSKAS